MHAKRGKPLAEPRVVTSVGLRLSVHRKVEQAAQILNVKKNALIAQAVEEKSDAIIASARRKGLVAAS